jgi:FHA domain-containing protein
LQPIETYGQAATLRREHFIARYPHPFLVHATGELQKLDPGRRDDLTSDRLVLEKPRKALHESMLIAPLVARDIDSGRITIGVAMTCDIVLDDASVSKRHAWFEQGDDESWLICDADSSAGTQVNNAPLDPAAPRLLGSGDRITLGYVEVMFLAADGFYDLIRGLFASD